MARGKFIGDGFMPKGDKRIPVHIFHDDESTRLLICMPLGSGSEYRVRRTDLTFLPRPKGEVVDTNSNPR